jgi:UDP-GlcNAc3NAcA epimerase
MIRILTIIGARPQIIKAAAISRAIRRHFRGRIEERMLHTGQHYDERMSAVFFEEMEIPPPDYRLSAGGGSHGEQTGVMLAGIERVLLETPFHAVLVYGDTNSTLAGALAAAKLHIPVIHVEAGLRSFNKSMPEELNRIACDHCSTLLFSPTATGLHNLQREGFAVDSKPGVRFSADAPGVFHCGDVMYDNTRYFSEVALRQVKMDPRLPKQGFVLVTVHRPYNTDDVDRLVAIIHDIRTVAAAVGAPVVIPMHPRTRMRLAEQVPIYLDVLNAAEDVFLLEPVSFLEMLYLEAKSKVIVTDSGGVQKEAYFLSKPSVVVRSETEWVEIVEHGSARLAFETGDVLQSAIAAALKYKPTDFPPIFGDGNAAKFICEVIHAQFS